MENEFSGIEKRLDELVARLARLRPLQAESREAFDEDPYLRDIVERNLEVAAQCCLDVANRIIALEGAQKPADYHEAIVRMGQIGVVSPGFARQLAHIAGFRNVLVHEYVQLDWDRVYRNLQKLDDLEEYATRIRVWLREKGQNDA
jgi:uncharacterized protein YutE (UPF0331/DUF86 family)